MNEKVDVLAVNICGRPIYRTTTHVIAAPDRIWSQHKSEKAAISALRLCRGGSQFHEMEILPLAAALARIGSAS